MNPGNRLPLAVTLAALAGTLAAAPDARAIAFRFPVDNAGGHAIWTAMIFGVDHDPEPGESRTDCVNYAGLGFPFCYDDHGGSDFLLDGGFATMDAGSATIVAAADGVVVRVVDGNYDRCHGSLQTLDVSCDGHEMRSNSVTLEHAGGWRTGYHHMKLGSVLVEEGDVVRCGEPLGLVGSSGYSTAPHVHFQVWDPQGETVDPFAGPYSQPETLWVQQDGPHGVPAERCEGEEPPPPEDVVAPGKDVGEGSEDVASDATEPAADAGPEPDAAAPAADVTASEDAPGPDAGAAAEAGARTRPDGHANEGGEGDALASLDAGGPLRAAGPLGCAVWPGVAPGDATAVLVPVVFVLALLLRRRARIPAASSAASPPQRGTRG